MEKIYLNDIKNELLSFKSILIFLSYNAAVYFMIKNKSLISLVVEGDNYEPLVTFTFGILSFISFLFSSILFSGIISRELESQSFRYIVPYISREKIYLSKYLVMMTYFLIMMFVSLILICIMIGKFIFPAGTIFNMIVFFFFIEVIVLLVSTIFPKERLCTLINILLSFSLPGIFVISNFRNNLFLDMVNWILPYKYIDSTWEIIVLIIITILLYILGNIIFKKKEL